MSQHEHHHEAPAPGTVDWRHNGVRVIKGNQLDSNTAQTPGMTADAFIGSSPCAAEIGVATGSDPPAASVAKATSRA